MAEHSMMVETATQATSPTREILQTLAAVQAGGSFARWAATVFPALARALSYPEDLEAWVLH